MSKPKQLMIANGRGDYGRNRTKRFPNGFKGHMWVAAYSKADAVRVLREAGYETMTLREFNIYWSKGCWGTPMDGITPERGVWFIPDENRNDDGFKPIRVI
jgi:hypothetical protein